MDSQLFGGSSPAGPRPSRKWNSSRAGSPTGDATAWVNQACSVEAWLGTTSTTIRRPSSCARRISVSASARVPKLGSMSRGSAMS